MLLVLLHLLELLLLCGGAAGLQMTMTVGTNLLHILLLVLQLLAAAMICCFYHVQVVVT
jgi:hypothetical protein